MSEIGYYWKTIDNFLIKNNNAIYNSLLGPADEKEINNLENIANVKLPDAFKESLLIHNGQDENNGIITFIDYQKLLSVHEMVKDYKMFCGLFENEIIDFIKPDECKYIKNYYIYNNKWLKITESNSDGLIMDFDPAEKGRVGQIFFRPHDDNPADKIIAETYEEWLKIICERLETGLYEIEDGEIVFEDFTFHD
ncbi:MAG: SMI1/KNR4 family protein [Spirochaetales bacterium]|jgi:cell wall assembly regulator SMI1|nr:SMI1/KNR4 family protein [Spirochaetales bacterium]